jgi:hypothetical protein
MLDRCSDQIGPLMMDATVPITGTCRKRTCA